MKIKKIFSIMLILIMLTTINIPVMATAQLSGTVIGSIPAVVSTGNASLANIRFIETNNTLGNIQTGDKITLTLPDGVVFERIYEVSATRLSPLFESPANNVVVTHPEVALGDTSVTLTLGRTADAFTPAQFILRFPVNVRSIGNGQISINITPNTPNINPGTFAVGTFSEGVITASGTGTIGSVSRFIFEPQGGAVTIQLRENAPGAFAAGVSNLVILRLPEGAAWSGTGTLSGGIIATINTNNRREMLVRTDAQSMLRTTYTLTPQFTISRLANLGNLTVEIEGIGENTGRTEGSVILAQITDFGILVRRPANVVIPRINIGRLSPSMPNAIELIESVRGSFIPGGTITLTLPQGFRWNGAPTIIATSSGITISPQGTRVSDLVYSFTVNNPSTSNATVSFNFLAGTIMALADASARDVTISVGGNAGATGDVVVATTQAPFTVSASRISRIDTRGQSFGQTPHYAGDIIITEKITGGILAGNVVLTLPEGIRFKTVPTVTVTSGNITLGTPAITNNNTLTIPVTSRGTALSTITVDKIDYIVDRFIADGDILVNIGGTALFDTGAPALQVVNARIGGRVSSIFTVGNISFTRDGQLVRMDATPMIRNNRTLLPLRFAALAIGITEDNIIWNATNRTVTLIHNARVVQMQINSQNIIINGVSIPIEAPATINNGRTFLPIRAIALALQADVSWNESARAVTVTPQ